MTKLASTIRWNQYRILSRPIGGEIDLVIGEVGEGSPVALVTAGIHGDEGPWSALAINKMLKETNIDELLGVLRIVPVANPLAMEANIRCSPLDNLDLNRMFPGNLEGSYTEKLAEVLTTHALEDVDTVIDLHGGGSWSVNSFAFQFQKSEELARAFKPPFLADAVVRHNTLTGYAQGKGAKVTAIEMGGKCQNEEMWITRLAKGLRSALGVAGVMTSKFIDLDLPEPISVDATKILRPSTSGLFLPNVGAEAVGTIVTKGKVLGKLLDPITMETIQTFRAPFTKTALLLLRPMLAVVEEDAMTYVVAPPKEEFFG